MPTSVDDNDRDDYAGLWCPCVLAGPSRSNFWWILDRTEVWMSSSNQEHRPLCGLLIALVLAACLGTTGCQVQTGGQTLPSPYYLTDDVQFFPPGPEFKLAREAAAMKAARQEMTAQQARP